ncbi:hypothetical protein G6O67_001688 [Ophiocordyceps sinensis]|uniref:Uncharacterized protein n=1 Tax=Ophiocordyceps sinensis TaxID=72228 RepID=A0A8H4V969_9HYPO|nr:hypothetical protein G6O67_001688 [Ophiocordyceps sinensis]
MNTPKDISSSALEIAVQRCRESIEAASPSWRLARPADSWIRACKMARNSSRPLTGPVARCTCSWWAHSLPSLPHKGHAGGVQRPQDDDATRRLRRQMSPQDFLETRHAARKDRT